MLLRLLDGLPGSCYKSINVDLALECCYYMGSHIYGIRADTLHCSRALQSKLGNAPHEKGNKIREPDMEVSSWRLPSYGNAKSILRLAESCGAQKDIQPSGGEPDNLLFDTNAA